LLDGFPWQWCFLLGRVGLRFIIERWRCGRLIIFECYSLTLVGDVSVNGNNLAIAGQALECDEALRLKVA